MRLFIYLILTVLLSSTLLQAQEKEQSKATLRVSVKIFEGNKPAEYARVHVHKITKIGEEQLHLYKLTNEEGVVHFKDLTVGDYILYVDGFWPPDSDKLIPITADVYAIKSADSTGPANTIEGYADGGRLNINSNKKVIHHTITLYPSAKLKVTVVYEDGTPIKGALVLPVDTKFGLKGFSKRTEGDKESKLVVGNVTNENGEYTILGFNPELEPEVSISISVKEDPFLRFDRTLFKVSRKKTVTNIKINLKQDNSMLIRFRRLERPKVVAKGKLNLVRTLTGKEKMAAGIEIFTQDAEKINILADDDFNYSLFDIAPGRYNIIAMISLAIADEDGFPILFDTYEKSADMLINKDKITILDITLTEDDKQTSWEKEQHGSEEK